MSDTEKYSIIIKLGTAYMKLDGIRNPDKVNADSTAWASHTLTRFGIFGGAAHFLPSQYFFRIFGCYAMNPFASFAFNAIDPTDNSHESGEDDTSDEEEKKEQACDESQTGVDTTENDGKVRFISGRAGRCVNGILIDYMFIPPPPRQTSTADTFPYNSSARPPNPDPCNPTNSESLDACTSHDHAN